MCVCVCVWSWWWGGGVGPPLPCCVGQGTSSRRVGIVALAPRCSWALYAALTTSPGGRAARGFAPPASTLATVCRCLFGLDHPLRLSSPLRLATPPPTQASPPRSGSPSRSSCSAARGWWTPSGRSTRGTWPTRTGDTGELVLREVRGSCPFPPAAAATSASSPEEKVVVQGGTAPGVKTLHMPASACAPPHPPSDPPCPPCPSLPRTAAASTRAPTTRGGGWIIFWCLPRWRHACMTATTCHRCRWGAGKRLPVQRAAQQGPLPAGVRAGREAGGRPGAVTSPLTNPALPSYRPLAILILQVLGSDHCPLGLVLKLDG